MTTATSGSYCFYGDGTTTTSTTTLPLTWTTSCAACTGTRAALRAAEAAHRRLWHAFLILCCQVVAIAAGFIVVVAHG